MPAIVPVKSLGTVGTTSSGGVRGSAGCRYYAGGVFGTIAATGTIEGILQYRQVG